MKTVSEWAREFNLLYNNISSNKAPGLDPYEISVFLTRAQESVVIGVYSGAFGDSFESTEAAMNYLAPLINTEVLTAEVVEEARPTNYKPIAGAKSHLFKTSNDFLFRIFEKCSLNLSSACPGVTASDAIVTPVTHDEYWRTIRNPFKKPDTTKVLRLVDSTGAMNGSGQLNTNKYSELISEYPINSYFVTYMKRPEPIILTNLSSRNLTINGETNVKTCLLDEALHQIILAEAVRMAKAAWNA